MKQMICLAFLALLFCSCDNTNPDQKTSAHPKYTCTRPISSAAPGIGFAGFSADQIGQVVISRYTAKTGWATLVSRDTLHSGNFHFEQDTAYALEPDQPADSFLLLLPGIDYKIRVLATAQEYEITAVTKPADEITWEQDAPCSPGASQTFHVTYSLDINGRPADPGNPARFAHGLYMYYLQH